ncbi:glycerol-3-phosphate 1-O-acyltransferase PlsY [Ammoniphilus sp. YIM 78166]|uniref:glycerol-3-phosphate 1-O-acyltransferase PlsY n=1 Tax=Ammoniphilus sp. YIM 78166 TaxID=1644106 RepID=UPI00196A27DD|nr:glycerol-3-phosphate 1-O-acyltransferase PlsY [Ammoniphilus sp. YIM 78166]
MYTVIAVIAGYLLGSISFSYLVAKKIAGIDIRQHGSGNAGATNTLRVLGKGPGILVLLLDALKGMVAVWLALWLTDGHHLATALAGAAAIVGHNWPVFYGFKGGKGVATTIGVIAALSFYPFLWSVLATLLVIYLTRYVSLGSLVFLVLIPIFMFVYRDPQEFIWMAIILAILGFARHSQNIVRLLQGKESKLGQTKK